MPCEHDMENTASREIGIHGFLKNPAAVAFANHCAAHLMALEYLAFRNKGAGKRDLALHESGHAVVAAAFGEPPAALELLDGAGRYGGFMTPSTGEARGNSSEQIGALMCMYAAGYLAEQSESQSVLFFSAAEDLAIVFYLAKVAETTLPGITATAALRAALSVSRAVLMRNRSQLQSLRTLLEEKRRLDASEIAGCLSGLLLAAPSDWGNLAREAGGSEGFEKEERALSVASAIASAPGVIDLPFTAPVMRDMRSALEGLARHERAAVMFSGGKESLVVAHMLKPYREKLTLVWSNTGAMFPHMADFVRAFADEHGYELVVVHSDQEGYFSQFGWPARIIPIHRNPAGKIKTGPWGACCTRLRSKPILDWMFLHGVRAIVHGQRAQDDVPISFVGQCEEIAPLWTWSEEDVYGYLQEHGIALPEQYGQGYADSGECWNCTAEIDPERFKWMRARYPALLVQLVPRIATVYGEVDSVMSEFRPGFDTAFAGYDAILGRSRGPVLARCTDV